MKATILTALALVACVSGGALPGATTDNSADFATVLKGYYAGLQTALTCGYESWHIPSFGPFKLDHYALDFQSKGYSIKGSVSNVIIKGLNNFKFLELDYDEKTNTVSMDYIFPEVQIFGEFDTESTIDIAGFPIDHSGNGVLNMKWTDLRAVGTWKITPTANGKGLEITGIEFHTYLANVEVNNWNNLWDIAGNNFANKMWRESLIMFSQQAEGLGPLIYEKYVLPKINESMENLTMKQLIDFMTNFSEKMKSTDCTRH